VPLDGQRRLCHNGAVAKLEIQNPVVKIIGYGWRWSKNDKKKVESSDFRVVKINFGTLGEGEWEEELSMAAMRQF